MICNILEVAENGRRTLLVPCFDEMLRNANGHSYHEVVVPCVCMVFLNEFEPVVMIGRRHDGRCRGID